MSSPSRSTTLTPRVAAIQIKMLHLHFRMKKIYDDQTKLQELHAQPDDKRELLKSRSNAAYSFIDMLTTMDHLADLVQDIFATNELRQQLSGEIYRVLNQTKKLTKRWKPVRNKLGGHVDIEMLEALCRKHHFLGVFLSEDLEADLVLLNMLMIEGAVNSARKTSDLFKRDLDFRVDLQGDLALLVNEINKDWKQAFSYFEPMMKFLYQIGKAEKIAVTPPERQSGLITD